VRSAGFVPPVHRISIPRIYPSQSIATFAGLYLEKPYGDVDSNAQRPARLLELIHSELRERDALAGPDLFVDTATVSILSR
jgi:hypothetical protein